MVAGRYATWRAVTCTDARRLGMTPCRPSALAQAAHKIRQKKEKKTFPILSSWRFVFFSNSLFYNFSTGTRISGLGLDVYCKKTIFVIVKYRSRRERTNFEKTRLFTVVPEQTIFPIVFALTGHQLIFPDEWNYDASRASEYGQRWNFVVEEKKFPPISKVQCLSRNFSFAYRNL